MEVRGNTIPDRDNVGMVKPAQMFHVCLFHVAHLLDGHLFMAQSAEEHGALRAAAEPRQVRHVLERYFPVVI